MSKQILSAGYRLTFLYTVQGKQHKQQNYLECVASSDPSGFDAVVRTGFTNPGVSTVVDPLFDKIKGYYPSTGVSFDGAVLYKRSGAIFVFQAAIATTKTPAGGTFEVANQVALDNKDTLNRALPVYFYEGEFGTALKIKAYGDLGGVPAALVNAFTNAGGTAVAVDPYAWKVSQDGALAGRFVSFVVDTNEKLRRIRGVK